jgi:CBS domain-containing protein
MRTTTTVGDVMTRKVITVGPATPFKDIIGVITANSISAVPVVDSEGKLLGVVSEADLLHKQEHQNDDAESGPSLFSGPRTREHWRKAGGRTAAELMTTPAPTVSAGTTLPDAARALSQAGVHRLFVIDGGFLAGVLARRDVLRTFLRGDEDIQAEIGRDVFDNALHANKNNVRATVEHGVVTLTGRLEYEGEVGRAVQLIHAIPGVVEVKNRMGYVWNGEGTRVGVTG